jgi:hypothetical protein
MLDFAERGTDKYAITLETIMENEIVVIKEGKMYVAIEFREIPQLIEMLQEIQENPEDYDVSGEDDDDEDDE